MEHVTKDDLQALRNDIAGMLRPAPPVVTEKNVVKKVKIPKKEVVIEVSEEEEEDVAPIKKKRPERQERQERQERPERQERQERQGARSAGLTGYDLLDALLKR